MGGTRGYEDEWKTRKNNGHGDWHDEKDWIKGYWDSVDHPHRKFLTDIIIKSNPKSVLEIGCNCGPNLRILAHRLPECKFVGIDINAESVAKGNEWFLKEGITNVELRYGKIEQLGDMFSDKSFDIVFTDAVLIYIGSDQIYKALQNILRIAQKKVVLLEWMFDSQRLSLGKYLITKGLWTWDYMVMIMGMGFSVHLTKLPSELWNDDSWQKYGYLIEVDK
jgi:ubiquinone/menaquinone biosynthesis C-methylase UbiE